MEGEGRGGPRPHNDQGMGEEEAGMARTRRRRRWWQWSREGGRHIEAPLPWTTLPPFPSDPTARGGGKKLRRTMQKGQKRDCCTRRGQGALHAVLAMPPAAQGNRTGEMLRKREKTGQFLR